MIGFDVKVKGEVVVDKGFTDFILIDGIALETNGFLFDCSDIWANTTPNPAISTTWTTPPSYSISTTWTRPTGGIYGDC